MRHRVSSFRRHAIGAPDSLWKNYFLASLPCCTNEHHQVIIFKGWLPYLKTRKLCIIVLLVETLHHSLALTKSSFEGSQASSSMVNDFGRHSGRRTWKSKMSVVKCKRRKKGWNITRGKKNGRNEN